MKNFMCASALVAALLGAIACQGPTPVPAPEDRDDGLDPVPDEGEGEEETPPRPEPEDNNGVDEDENLIDPMRNRRAPRRQTAQNPQGDEVNNGKRQPPLITSADRANYNVRPRNCDVSLPSELSAQSARASTSLPSLFLCGIRQGDLIQWTDGQVYQINVDESKLDETPAYYYYVAASDIDRDGYELFPQTDEEREDRQFWLSMFVYYQPGSRYEGDAQVIQAIGTREADFYGESLLFWVFPISEELERRFRDPRIDPHFNFRGKGDGEPYVWGTIYPDMFAGQDIGDGVVFNDAIFVNSPSLYTNEDGEIDPDIDLVPGHRWQSGKGCLGVAEHAINQVLVDRALELHNQVPPERGERQTGMRRADDPN